MDGLGAAEDRTTWRAGLGTSSDDVKVELDEPISPELALVDPDLAARARRALPERPPWPRPPVRAVASPSLVPIAAPAEPREAERPPRALQLALLASAFVAGIIALSALATVLLGREPSRRFASEATAQAPTTASSIRAQAAGSPTPTALPAASTSRQFHRLSAPAPGHRRSVTADVAEPRARSTAPRPVETPLLAWHAAEGASHYRIEMFASGRKVFEAITAEPRFRLPSDWTYGETRHRLGGAHYRLLVRPGFGPPSRPRYGRRVFAAWVS